MSKTVGDILIGVLDDLGEAELKKFRRKLCDRKQEPKVRRGIVEKADPVDLVDILTRTFTEDGAVNVAIEVLGAINCQDVAEELTEFKKCKSNKVGGTSIGHLKKTYIYIYNFIFERFKKHFS